MLSFKKNKHSHVVPPAPQSNRTFCGDGDILNLLHVMAVVSGQCLFLPLSSLSLLQTSKVWRLQHSIGWKPFLTLRLTVFQEPCVLFYAEQHGSLDMCVVQILQRLLSPTSPLVSVPLWSLQLAFPCEDTGPLHRVPFAWDNCQPSTPSLSSDSSLSPLLPLEYFLTSLSKLVNVHALISGLISCFCLLQPSLLKHCVLQLLTFS